MSIITSNLGAHFRAATAGGAAPLPATQQLRDYRMPKGGSPHGMRRTASSGLAGAAMGAGTNADVRSTSPEIRNPLLSMINFYLPYDRKTLNQWIRYYRRFDPWVGNCIDLNATFPISDFRFTGITDPGILQDFEYLKERTNQVQWCFEMSAEEETLGEAFSFWNWDDDENSWTDYTILNPDLLDVQLINWGSGQNAVYTYDPPQELKALIKDKDPRVIEMLQEQLDSVVLQNLLAGKRMPLDDFNVVALVRREHAYESRGTAPAMRCLKDLMLKDKLREVQYAVADQQITPAQLWKLGDPASGYMPTQDDLDDFRNMLIESRHDPIFNLVTHGAVNLDLVGYTGKVMDIQPQMDWIAKQVMIAFFVNEAVISGSGPGYNNAFIAFKAIQGRYQSKRDKLTGGLRTKIYKPYAEANEMWDRSTADVKNRVRTTRKSKHSDGTNKALIPGIEFNFKLDLTDQAQRMQFLMQLRDKTQVPMRTMCEVLDLPYDSVKAALKAEEGTVFDPVYQKVRADRADKAGMVPSMHESDTMTPMGGGGAAPAGGGEDLGGEGETGGAVGGEGGSGDAGGEINLE